jgi:site-specific DNA recombinase
MQSEASIEDQMRLCRERASREGWQVVREFSDHAMSGASMVRPGLQELLAEARRGAFDVLITEALDRLSRDQADVASLYKHLVFAGVRIVTLAEGEVNELHVGLKGTMNQLFLKDLANKTRRGLRGRVEQGMSGGGLCYGYDVVRRLGPNGERVTGERTINDVEAQVVRRIFEAFAEGRSPKAIARDLNKDGVPGPRGKLWRDTAIRGHITRGTGILNNELYAGRLVWNRMRYIKDPQTGRRVSRINAKEAWITHDVPHLRIIENGLWERVRSRQGKIRESDRSQNIRATRFWEHKRASHLLTGLLVCGHCGGKLISVGRDYLACGNARKLGTCTERQSWRREHLEGAVLDVVRLRLMEPDAVAQFMKAVAEEWNEERRNAAKDHVRLEHELAAIESKLTGLYDAIAEGLRTPGLLARLEDLERQKAEMQQKVERTEQEPVRLHPNLSELYRRKVADLAGVLEDEAFREPTLEKLRGLIEEVSVFREGSVTRLEVRGALTAMLDLASAGLGLDRHVSTAKVVAGAGFEPAAFRL